MKKIESLKNPKFKENIITNLISVAGGSDVSSTAVTGPGNHIFWRFTNDREVTNYSNCGDNDIRTYTCDASKDGHTTGSWNYCA